MPGIQSERVILIEGDADEIVPNAKLGTNMHGFVIMVPPGEGGERLLDMVWRITMCYAAMPRLLARRTTVRKMVEAVMGKEHRQPPEVRHPVRESGKADRKQDNQFSSNQLIRPDPPAEGKLRRAIASTRKPQKGSKTKTPK